MLPAVAAATEVSESEVEIKTPDGTCDAHFVHPAKATAAVLVWPDILGLRPAFRAMGKRLAESGYAVLTVNPFYRSIKGTPASREDAFSYAKRSAPPRTCPMRRPSWPGWTRRRPVDRHRKIGTTGYCMGGPIVFRTAGSLPKRIGAGCSFHGGGLTTTRRRQPSPADPEDESQHADRHRGQRRSEDPTSKDILRKAFDAAKLSAEIEVYKGANHGWMPPDSQNHNAEAAEEGWARKAGAVREGARRSERCAQRSRAADPRG
jgi:carboxymethylenebutenolidase